MKINSLLTFFDSQHMGPSDLEFSTNLYKSLQTHTSFLTKLTHLTFEENLPVLFP